MPSPNYMRSDAMQFPIPYSAAMAAILSMGAALPSTAGVSIAGTGGANALSVTDAQTFQINRGGGTGHIAIVPYFSTQNGNSTLLSITNTDSYNGKVVKLRFRGASNGDNLLDLTILLQAGDAWAASISQDTDGLSRITTEDTSCTLPRDTNLAFSTSRVSTALSATERAAWTREGYIEIITAADIPFARAQNGGSYRPLPVAIGAAGQYKCPKADAPALAALLNEPASEQEALSMGLDTPSTGLLVNSIIINVAGASVAWSTPTTMLTAVTAAGTPGRGRLVFSPQTDDTATQVDQLTNDPLLRSAARRVQPRQFDLPDLSTPYLGTAAIDADAPFRHVEALSAGLSVPRLVNEFVRDLRIDARTDWTVTMPTRRYAVAMEPTALQPVFNVGAHGNSRYFTPAVFTSQAQRICATKRYVFMERQGYTSDVESGATITGSNQFRLTTLCGNASVLPMALTSQSALNASLTTAARLSGRFDPPPYPYYQDPNIADDGWAVLDLDGLPAIGSAYFYARGPLVADKSTSFGWVYNHAMKP
ncbi:hypothetical protein AAFF27_02795 [Xylophilus sp. GW821-FHT01B05]